MSDIQIQSMMMFMPIILVAVLWSFFWKGLGLWHAARKGDSAWFVVMLLINTLGILEIIYLFGILQIKAEKLFKK